MDQHKIQKQTDACTREESA